MTTPAAPRRPLEAEWRALEAERDRLVALAAALAAEREALEELEGWLERDLQARKRGTREVLTDTRCLSCLRREREARV